MAEIDENESTDQIIEEAREIKAALAESVNYDIDRILAEARKKQETSDRIIVLSPIRQD